MQKRTVIAKLPDGHIVVDKHQLSHRKVSGDAHQRRVARAAIRRGEVQLEWHRTERHIFRHGTVSITNLADGIQIMPLGAHNLLAAENEQIAQRFVHEAAAKVADIEAANSLFTVKPIRKVRVVIEEID